MQERLQEIVFKNPTRTALILTTIILSSVTVPVVLNSFLVFFLNFVEEFDILTWNTTAAKIAQKKIQLRHCCSSQKSGLRFETMRRCIFLLFEIIFDDYYLDRNPPPIMSYTHHTCYQEKHRVKMIAKISKTMTSFCGFCHTTSTLTVLITLPPGFKEKPHVNLQSTILLRNMSWINLETRNTQDDDIKL